MKLAFRVRMASSGAFRRDFLHNALFFLPFLIYLDNKKRKEIKALRSNFAFLPNFL